MNQQRRKETCTKHNMFSANAGDIAVDDKNLCDLIKKKKTQDMNACVYSRTNMSTRRERNDSIRMESKLMLMHTRCSIV